MSILWCVYPPGSYIFKFGIYFLPCDVFVTREKKTFVADHNIIIFSVTFYITVLYFTRTFIKQNFSQLNLWIFFLYFVHYGTTGILYLYTLAKGYTIQETFLMEEQRNKKKKSSTFLIFSMLSCDAKRICQTYLLASIFASIGYILEKRE